MTLRERLAKARRRYRDAKQKKADTSPHSDRRKKLAGLVRFWRDRKDRLVARLDKRRHHHALAFGTAPGAPDWGGSEHVLVLTVVPVYTNAGFVTTSAKRAADDPLSIENPSSDHSAANVTASARDCNAVNDYELRNAVCRALGIEAVIQDYGFYYFYVNGVRYRVQPIAQEHGTGPHLHIGVKRA